MRKILKFQKKNYCFQMNMTVKELRDSMRLKDIEYEIAFECVLDRIIAKMSFEAAVKEDHREINHVDFLKWILRHPQRKERYYEALEIRAELVSEELIGIADGNDSLEDLERSKLRIKTRKEQMAIWNRKRFNDVKQIDITSTISITAALEEARARSGGFASHTLIHDVEDALRVDLPSLQPIEDKTHNG